jgi:hypothetical protein
VLQHVERRGLVGSEEQGWAPAESVDVPLGRKHVARASGRERRESRRGSMMDGRQGCEV